MFEKQVLFIENKIYMEMKAAFVYILFHVALTHALQGCPKKVLRPRGQIYFH